MSTKTFRLTHTRLWDGQRIRNGELVFRQQILADATDAQTINLNGYTIFPGLINAHDHLELNHFPRTKRRGIYPNASHWAHDMNEMLNTHPFVKLKNASLKDRVFIGGLKNLLSGTTSVIHHNPPHNPLFKTDYPVHVIRQYGWSHSFYLNTPDELIETHHNHQPWFIHLAEGTDKSAQQEYEKLCKLGIADKNTVVVHGVGIPDGVIHDAAYRLRGLVWCPTTNQYLLGQTASIHSWLAVNGTVALGSDSRLTADGDLLDEMRYAREFVTARDILEMVTVHAQKIAGVADIGHLNTGAKADFILIENSDDDIESLVQSKRSDLALIVRNGIPLIGDPAIMEKFSQFPTVEITLDKTPKRIHLQLARKIAQCKLEETGLHLKEKLPNRFSVFSRK